jgi:hypothetical protein
VDDDDDGGGSGGDVRPIVGCRDCFDVADNASRAAAADPSESECAVLLLLLRPPPPPHARYGRVDAAAAASVSGACANEVELLRELSSADICAFSSMLKSWSIETVV